jgi:hypothetical protein
MATMRLTSCRMVLFFEPAHLQSSICEVAPYLAEVSCRKPAAVSIGGSSKKITGPKQIRTTTGLEDYALCSNCAYVIELAPLDLGSVTKGNNEMSYRSGCKLDQRI